MFYKRILLFITCIDLNYSMCMQNIIPVTCFGYKIKNNNQQLFPIQEGHADIFVRVVCNIIAPNGDYNSNTVGYIKQMHDNTKDSTVVLHLAQLIHDYAIEKKGSDVCAFVCERYNQCYGDQSQNVEKRYQNALDDVKYVFHFFNTIFKDKISQNSPLSISEKQYVQKNVHLIIWAYKNNFLDLNFKDYNTMVVNQSFFRFLMGLVLPSGGPADKYLYYAFGGLIVKLSIGLYSHFCLQTDSFLLIKAFSNLLALEGMKSLTTKLCIDYLRNPVPKQTSFSLEYLRYYLVEDQVVSVEEMENVVQVAM